MPKRTRLATGIYRDASGISVIVPTHGKPKEHRFESDRPVEFLIRWRTRALGKAADEMPHDPRGSLARDVVCYLKRLKATPGYKSEKSHLRAWLLWFSGTKRRWQITAEDCDLAIADWREHGYSARTIRHRVRALMALYHRLDGPKAETPVDNAILPPKPKPRALSVADAKIEAVALELRKHEIAGWLRDAKTRARFLVLATHSQRPAELQRAHPEDVDLQAGLWGVRAAKGGYNVAVPLNDEQRAAWALFIAAKAWGAYDSRSFSKTLQRAGWPKGIRPYNLRHSTGIALSRRGVALEDIQQLMTHASSQTTQQFYVPGLIERLASATKLLEGRFGGAPFFPRAVPTSRQKRNAKGRELSRQSESG